MQAEQRTRRSGSSPLWTIVGVVVLATIVAIATASTTTLLSRLVTTSSAAAAADAGSFSYEPRVVINTRPAAGAAR
ncbi:MAG: hypothetical protein HY329_05415 [Chloroflexi bacterium]|nr:hypothetical protein [Chloroflexota bacterium]